MENDMETSTHLPSKTFSRIAIGETAENSV